MPALLVALPLRALADDPKHEAAHHVETSAKLYGAGNFSEALQELTIAYGLDPQPGLLYAIGQVHVKLGQCPEAISFYKRFLETNPDPHPTQAAREAIAACERATVNVKPEPTPPPQPPPPPPRTPDAPVASGHAWYADPVTDVLVGAGIAAGVAGIVIYRSGLHDFDRAELATDYATHHALIESGRSDRTYALAASVGSIALIAGGLAYHLFVRSDGPTVALAPTSGGAALAVGGRF